jgi:muramoyltetrapeptide carboxypeptidase LdcA involved in peptidoglycan recycling
MILDECLEGYDFPVATGLDFAHTNPIATIPIGTKAVVDVDAFNLVYLETYVKK